MKNTLTDFVNKLKAEGHVVVSVNRRASVREMLSVEEKSAIAVDLAQKVQEAALKEEDIKAVNTTMKNELKAIEVQIAASSNLLTTGYRVLMKPAIVVADFTRRVRVFLDPETGEEVGTEPLMEGDFQMKIDMENAQAAVREPEPIVPAPIGSAFQLAAPTPAPEPAPGAIEADYEIVDPKPTPSPEWSDEDDSEEDAA